MIKLSEALLTNTMKSKDVSLYEWDQNDYFSGLGNGI